MRDAIAVAVALFCGLVLASYDTRTDDTAIELGLLLIASAALAFVAPRRWWAIAVLVGGFIPLIELSVQSGSKGVPPGVIALVITFIGALIGFGIARASRVGAA